MGNCLSNWYNEGIETDPPPCLNSKTFYCICSDNCCCYCVGMMGTEWGRKNRSQIFFVAFWLSFAGLFFLCAALASLSTTQMSSIENVPFFQGSLTVTENSITSDMYYYAGVNRIVINGCEADTSCPPDWLGWGDDSCNKYFSNCHSCRTAKGSATFPFVMAILGQVGQVATDLTRSTESQDVHCQKFLGLFAGVMGMIGTLTALSDFGSGCMNELKTNPDMVSSMTRRPGAAFVLILLATLLRLFDIWAHIIVPVPKENYWTPDSRKNKKNMAALSVDSMERGPEVVSPRDNAARRDGLPDWVRSDDL